MKVSAHDGEGQGAVSNEHTQDTWFRPLNSSVIFGIAVPVVRLDGVLDQQVATTYQ
jgi:hypothetical protein